MTLPKKGTECLLCAPLPRPPGIQNYQSKPISKAQNMIYLIPIVTSFLPLLLTLMYLFIPAIKYPRLEK